MVKTLMTCQSLVPFLSLFAVFHVSILIIISSYVLFRKTLFSLHFHSLDKVSSMLHVKLCSGCLTIFSSSAIVALPPVSVCVCVCASRLFAQLLSFFLSSNPSLFLAGGVFEEVDRHAERSKTSAMSLLLRHSLLVVTVLILRSCAGHGLNRSALAELVEVCLSSTRCSSPKAFLAPVHSSVSTP